MRQALLFIVAVAFGPHGGYAQTLSCPEDRTVVELSGVGDSAKIARQRARFVKSVESASTIVRLGQHAVASNLRYLFIEGNKS